MIYITFTRPTEKFKLITHPAIRFDNLYDEEWFKNDLVKEILEEIENVIHIDGDYFKHNDFGGLSAKDLSTGTKTLILLLMSDVENKVFQLSNIGDNCYNILGKIGKIKDIVLYGNCNICSKDGEIEYYILESGKVVDNVIDYLKEKLIYEK